MKHYYRRTLFWFFVFMGLCAWIGFAVAAEKKASVVAVVNGAEIEVEEFNREVIRVQRLVLGAGRALTCGQINQIKTEVVAGLVRRELLYQEAKKQGIKVEEAAINEELKKVRAQYASDTDFSNALSVMKISPEALRSQVERALAIQQIIEKQFAVKAVVNDKEIWNYYDRNRESFRQPEQIRAGHILIKADHQGDEARKAEARKKIESIQTQLRTGQDFAAMAKAHSEDSSASKGGDLGYIRTGQVVKPFEEALFSLKPGETSDIVETPLGFHLIKAGDRKAEMTIPFENVKDQIRQAMKLEKGKEEANAYIAKVRETAKVEIRLPEEK